MTEAPDRQAGATLCDKCYSPGACCRNLMLYNVNGVDLFMRAGEDAAAVLPGRLAEAGLPFEPLAPGWRHRSPEGDPVLIWMFSCRALDAAGRCSVYDDRPSICRGYVPASDPLCVHYQGSEAGDPSGCEAFALRSQHAA